MISILKQNVDITAYSNFRVKAEAKYLYEMNKEEDVFLLKELWRFCEDNNLWMTIIWRWTNILFAFDYYDWIIVKNNLQWWSFDEKTKILESYSNEPISNIARELKNKYNNDIWYRFIWLPWWVWGAVFWNAGCFWLEVWNNFLEARVYNLDTWKIEILNKEQMQFEYRNSFVKRSNNYFIISVRFDLSKVIEKYSSTADVFEFRKNKQPKGLSCGSFFRNPSHDNPAWRIIEEIWLKWYKCWGAYFSNEHANFLMSDWTASYKDLLELIALAKEKAKKEKNINLISEVRIIKNGRN